MKKQILCLFIGGALLATSCSRTPESKETEYTSNVKGFLNAKNNEEGEPVFNMISLSLVTDDWDGKEDFSPNSGDDKLVKVEFSIQSTDGSVDIGMMETNLGLFDSSTKKTYPASVSLATGPTLQALMSTFETGYAVFSVPVDTKLDNLYLGASTKDGAIDLSKENIESLLPLKKMEAPAEKTVALSASHAIEDIIFGMTKTYTFKSVTFNANDDKVKNFHSANPGMEGYSFVKLELDIDNSSKTEKAWVNLPYLISEYGYSIPDYDSSFGEKPSDVQPGKTSLTLYYRVRTGEKVIAFVGEDRKADDYSVKL
ncbi:hypothetical protein H9Y05_08195 [Crocinitomicaceae bacterium CZZ-1]|uniref:Uncharacterized protein n=1 Tax=Taishania pollutisoli TaxID=2766479 RepID=A0A8J6P943_9FLAO|nr:hypothetical protein [Taishania pollutisoli]MBC9812451.1 hypothetical protein [Taishania pollutisoli]MBX2949344.1 hypothetical protein [Crocinitomicaceae bacterium]NGF74423.1 hypothetical protein [Fluviicola sp. SGL-29]